MIGPDDRAHLRRAVDLATDAIRSGNPPFGSVLVSREGDILFEDHNRVVGGDHTQHPEFAIARWAANNLTPEERADATVYTSGEHCPMCAAAHGWVGLGRIVYAASSPQLTAWLAELGIPRSRVRSLRIEEVIEGAVVDGPVPELAEEIRGLHRSFRGAQRGAPEGPPAVDTDEA